MTRRGLFRLLGGAAAVPVAAVAAVLPYPKGTWVPRSGTVLLQPLPHFKYIKYIDLRRVEHWRMVAQRLSPEIADVVVGVDFGRYETTLAVGSITPF